MKRRQPKLAVKQATSWYPLIGLIVSAAIFFPYELLQPETAELEASVPEYVEPIELPTITDYQYEIEEVSQAQPIDYSTGCVYINESGWMTMRDECVSDLPEPDTKPLVEPLSGGNYVGYRNDLRRESMTSEEYELYLLVREVVEEELQHRGSGR